MSKKIQKYFIMTGILISFSTIAAPSNGLFSDKNFQALKNDPAALFSKTNSCRLKSLLPKQDYDAFKETMNLMTDEEDIPTYLSISGNVKGLFTIMEGFFRISKSGKVWIAYLQNDQVHYFTNDESSLKQPPKIMQSWSSRFKDAKWIAKPIAIQPNQCP